MSAALVFKKKKGRCSYVEFGFLRLDAMYFPISKAANTIPAKRAAITQSKGSGA
jgi:hypothetical protein